MTITGEALIGGDAVCGNGGSFQAFDPSTRAAIEPSFHMVDAAQIDEACRLAEAAFDPLRATSNEARATFLETIAAQILELGDELIVRAMTESGLPRARLEGERWRFRWPVAIPLPHWRRTVPGHVGRAWGRRRSSASCGRCATRTWRRICCRTCCATTMRAFGAVGMAL